MFDPHFDLGPPEPKPAPAHLPFFPDVDIKRIDCLKKDGSYILVFDLITEERTVRAFEYVTEEGYLVPLEQSGIRAPQGKSLHPDDLVLVRMLLDHRFFYDLQAVGVEYYNAYICSD